MKKNAKQVEIYIGKNGIGKSKKLEEISKKLKKDNITVIELNTEIKFKDELAKEKSTKTSYNVNHDVKKISRCLIR